MRVIADHARTTAFLIAEGIFPDRAGREYVLRRVMRRAIRHGHRLGIREPLPARGRARGRRADGRRSIPELERRKELIASVARSEEERFRETIERGLKILDEEIGGCERARQGRRSAARRAFKLLRHVRLPLDLTQVIAQERGLRRSTSRATSAPSRSSAPGARARRSARRPSRTCGATCSRPSRRARRRG